ncbi:MAG TPA: ABC transporter permease [Candidatus Binataceae bacterium]|nr:ABC transporter permease [Candidatus Binataceae bacterium]
MIDGSIGLEPKDDGVLLIRLSGGWHLGHGRPSAVEVERRIASSPVVRSVAYDTGELSIWDSSLVNFLHGVGVVCRQRGIVEDRSGLPNGMRQLLALAESVPQRTGARPGSKRLSFVEQVGTEVVGYARSFGDFIDFFGRLCIAFARMFAGKARFRTSDLLAIIQQCGADALLIVSLISYLVGVILAFMGAVQLQQFGAAIYVADLVGIGVTREMGAMMTAIIMAGRTGAAFAAQLGTMKVTQETDALTTTGLSPMEFLVLPRTIALILMMPLLCLYSDFVGILGGASVGVGMLHLSFTVYIKETIAAVTLGDVFGGLFKSAVYGVLIAVAGCWRGFQCGSSSSAVGDAATSAVVSGIVMIVTACGLFAVIFNILGI